MFHPWATSFRANAKITYWAVGNPHFKYFTLQNDPPCNTDAECVRKTPGCAKSLCAEQFRSEYQFARDVSRAILSRGNCVLLPRSGKDISDSQIHGPGINIGRFGNKFIYYIKEEIRSKPIETATNPENRILDILVCDGTWRLRLPNKTFHFHYLVGSETHTFLN